MPDHHSTRFRGVIYARCSSPQQEKSIDQQLSWAADACKGGGIDVAGTYTDEGVSGHATSKRTGFHEMLAFCREQARLGQPIDVIVCWHSNRFSRADSIETSWFLQEFRLCGIGKMLTQEKWYDFDRVEDRVMLTVSQDTSNNAYSVNLANASTRSKVEVALQGGYNGGPVPYGYRVRYTAGADGSRPEADGFAIDPETSPLVVWIFETYASGKHSLRELCEVLNRQGTPAPSRRLKHMVRASGLWNISTIRNILHNETYLGKMLWNQSHQGRFLGVIDCKLVPMPQRGKQKDRPTAPKDVIRKEDAHEPIIGPDLFERARLRLLQQRRRTTPHRGGGGMLLTRLLRCGSCGSRMTGRLEQGKRYYICYNYLMRGSQACRCNRIPEAALAAGILHKLKQELTPERLGRIRQLIEAEAAMTTDNAGTDLAALEGRLADAETQVSRASRRLLIEEDEGALPDLRRELTSLRAQRDNLSAEVATARRKTAGTPDVSELVERAMAWIARLEKAVEAPFALADLRVFFLDTIDRVELHFSHEQRGQRTYSKFARGLIWLRDDCPGASILSSACRRSARSTA